MPATYEQLAKTTLTASSTTITFSSISQSYTDLVFVVQMIAFDTTGPTLRLRFNNDSGVNYGGTQGPTWVTGGGVPTSNGGTDTNGNIARGIGVGGSTSRPSTAVINIHNYSNTSYRKSWFSWIVNGNFGAGAKGVEMDGGAWNSNSAITSVSLEVGTNAFNTGTFCALYGIKAA